MGKLHPDYSFERDGLSLPAALGLLLSDQPAERLRAGEALWAMQMGLPSVHTDFEDLAEVPRIETQQARFAQAIRDAVSAPGFNTADFVRRLCAFAVSLDSDWQQRVAKMLAGDSLRDQQFDRLADRLVSTINVGQDEGEREHAQKRFARLVAAYICGRNAFADNPAAGAEGMSGVGMAAYAVFESLGEQFLEAPEALEMLLGQKQLRHRALSAIERLGPPGIEFAQSLLQLLDEQRRYFDGARALGSIGRGSPMVVNELINRLRSPALQRTNAVSTLMHMNAEVCGREREIVDLLRPMLLSDDEFHTAVWAFASVGRHLADVRSEVIDLARPRPPRMKSSPDLPGHQYDAVMYERGNAISALSNFREYAVECVAVLIDAMDTFEEYDPDESGPISRVSWVLRDFGSGGAAAAVPLARHLAAAKDDHPRAILEALGAMGPAAASALPMLLEFRDAMVGEEPLPDLGAGPADKLDDLAGWAIQRIRGLRSDTPD